MFASTNVSGMKSAKGFLFVFALAATLLASVNAEAARKYRTSSTALKLSSQPASATLYEGGSTTFSMTATSSKTITYTWYKNGVVTGSNSKSLSISNATLGSAGTYSCKVTDGSTTINCNPFTLTVNQIVRITSQPASQTLNEGSTASMSVAATGTAPISYQWYYNGSAISGATASTLSLSALTSAKAGSYYAIVKNGGSSATSSTATLSVTATAPLSLTTQPSSAAIYEGGSTTFSMAATSGKAITYTWYKNGVVTGSNSNSLTISNATLASAGTYSCQASDGSTTISCNPFTLTVNEIVRITAQPSNLALNAGNAAALTVAATGTAPLTYQWYYNGSAISGATASTLSLSSVSTANAGSYYCIVKNPGSSATSGSALLSVLANVSGKAQISWTRPTTRADGTALNATEIAGYDLYYSAGSSTALTKLTSVTSAELSVIIDELAAGTHYFAVATTDTSGVQSSLSPTFSVTIN